jgi:hypothetical protein
MGKKGVPRAPAGAGRAGRALWAGVCDSFELGPHELLILKEACRVADVCEDLAAVVARDGAMLEGSEGPRLHPALRELRAERLCLSRMLVSLRMPWGDEDQADRGQYRGTRGFYAIRGEG